MLATLRRRWRGGLAALAVVAVLVVGGVAGYYGTPRPADGAAAQAVVDDPAVEVDRAYGGYVLRPANDPDANDLGGGRTAVVFYPGGRVSPESYLATFAYFVEENGVAVYVPAMPLNLAILDQGAAGRIIEDHPEVDRWYVGGHSLGGVFACRFARANPGEVRGVFLFGSYCDQSLDGTGLRALAVVGGRDQVLDRQAFADDRDNLPEDARVVRIDGMNHSQFGAYGGQPGDVPATIDRETAHVRMADDLARWITDPERHSPLVR